MTYKDFFQKYVGKKGHFESSMEGQYLLDFTGASFANVLVKGAHQEFLAIFDEVEKVFVIVPYAKLLVKVSNSGEKGQA